MSVVRRKKKLRPTCTIDVLINNPQHPLFLLPMSLAAVGGPDKKIPFSIQ
jgi:hypothetical protein